MNAPHLERATRCPAVCHLDDHPASDRRCDLIEHHEGPHLAYQGLTPLAPWSGVAGEWTQSRPTVGGNFWCWKHGMVAPTVVRSIPCRNVDTGEPVLVFDLEHGLELGHPWEGCWWAPASPPDLPEASS